MEAVTSLEAEVSRRSLMGEEDRLAAVYLAGEILNGYNATMEENQSNRFIEVGSIKLYEVIMRMKAPWLKCL